MTSPAASDTGALDGPDLIPWSTLPAATIIFRLALVATVTASVSEAALLRVGGLVPGDHLLVGTLIAGSLVATLTAHWGRARLSGGILIAAFWLCAAGAVILHGPRTASLPLLVMSTALSALWGGVRIGIALVVASCVVLTAASGFVGPILPPPVATTPQADLVVVLGQFVFLAALLAYLGRGLHAARAQSRLREQRLASTTEELAASRGTLAATETRYAELVHSLPDTVIVFDAEGRFVEVAGEVKSAFGRTREQVVGRRMGELRIMSESDVALSYGMLRRLFAGENVPSFTVSGRHVDGSLRWVEVTSRLLVYPGGEPNALVIMRDITARREGEQALLLSDARWRRASRISLLGSWELDLDTDTLVWDEEVRRLHDVPPDFVPSVDSAIEFYAPEARPVIRAAVETLIASGAPYSLELPLITATGRRIHVRGQGEAEMRDGRAVKLYGIFQDITDLHEATQLLRETVKLEGLGRLAGGVAHDFNNLLTAILGYAEELQHALPPDSQEFEDVVEIRRAGDRARELTMQLLAFARRQVVLPRVFGVETQLEHVRRFLVRVLGEDIALTMEIDPDVGTLHMDPTQFEQLLLNLAVNARDAMPTGGALTIRASRARLAAAAASARELASRDCVLLEVQDSGSGMSPEVAARVFEPFFTTKELGHGTGLGLATAYGVVRQAKGHIAVRSTLGRGTSFVVHLPRAGDIAPALANEPVQAHHGGSETILLVEDDDSVRRFAERVLQDAGYDVRVAAHGAEAEAIARSVTNPLQLLVTDVVMPGMSGPDLAERLERRWPSLRTLFVSGYTEERMSSSRLDSPSDFLAKPYGRQQLLESVRRLLDDTSTVPPA